MATKGEGEEIHFPMSLLCLFLCVYFLVFTWSCGERVKYQCECEEKNNVRKSEERLMPEKD